MKRKNFFFTLLIASLLLFNIHELDSQSTQKKKDKGAIQHEVSVTLKLIQVYVTDKDGRPVTNLDKSDFEIFDNRKRKTITEFEIHSLLFPSEKTSLEQIKTDVPSPRILNRKFFLFFDFAFNNARGIIESKKAALHFIDNQLLPTDEVGILSYSKYKGIALNEYLTADHKKIHRVIKGLGLKEIMGRVTEADAEIQALQRDKALELGFSGVIDASDENLPEEQRMIKEAEDLFLDITRRIYRDHVLTLSKKLKGLAKALRYVPGQKHIILFSSGIISEVLYGSPFKRNVRGGRMPVNPLIDDASMLRDNHEEMIKELAAANCQVFALDSTGLAPASDTSNTAVLSDFTMTGEASLRRIANTTGGKYFGNINNYQKSLKEIQDLTGFYYVLGYYVDEKWDGRYHKIKVKVKRKGYKVHAQGGYFNPKPFSKYSNLEKRIHLMDLALSQNPQFQTPILFPLKTLACSTGVESTLVMISKIPVEKLQAAPNKKVEITNIIFDEKNTVVYLKKWAANLSKLSQKKVYHYFRSTISPGTYKCRVVIRNLRTGKGAVASSSVVIPKTLDPDQRLDPPLLAIPEVNAHYLNVEEKMIGGRPLSLLTIFKYNPSLYSPLIGELNQETAKLYVLTRYSLKGIQNPNIKYSVRLIQLFSGRKMPLTSLLIDKYQDSEKQTCLLELQIKRLSPGTYQLYIFAEDANSKSISHALSSFMVK